jgi:hypothetical protein
LNWRINAEGEQPIEERPVDDTHTIRELNRCVGIAIGRWLMSGLPCPDWQATDGVSIEEADMELAESES